VVVGGGFAFDGGWCEGFEGAVGDHGGLRS
jgi:hypothetical protein